MSRPSPADGYRQCDDCGGQMSIYVQPGFHGLHMASAPCGHLVHTNCRNRPIADCYECAQLEAEPN